MAPKDKVTTKKTTALAPAAKPSGSSLDRLKHRANNMQPTTEREILIPLDKIRFDPNQPRQSFHALDGRVSEADEAAINEMAESIKANELIQAITVRELGDGTYQVVVGERRTRAHLKLGLSNIRAIVRNDLNNSALRLLYQMAENVNRQDLTDDDMSKSIRRLLAGDKDNNVPPLNQSQIASRLGKSEGWVSRFVKFGEAEVQRVWVQSGIADTVEKVYRLSILPETMKIDIVRRTELPVDDPQYLEKPLNRSVIDALTVEARQAKRPVTASQTAPSAPVIPVAPAGVGAAKPEHSSPSTQHSIPVVATNNAGKEVGAGSANASASQSQATEKYTLPDQLRSLILGNKPDANLGAGSSRGSDPLQAPVNCRVPLRSITALLEMLQDEETMHDSTLDAICEVNFPGALAKLIANKLVGVIVADQEIPAVMQTELTKLG